MFKAKNVVQVCTKEHPESQILGDQRQGIQARRKLIGGTNLANLALLSQIEPKNLYQESEYEFWVKAMNEELDKIEKNETWDLVPRPKKKNVIGTKWFFKNKLNEEG